MPARITAETRRRGISIRPIVEPGAGARRGGGAAAGSSLQDRVELLILERLVEPRLRVRVEVVAQADDAEHHEEAFEPAAGARRAAGRTRNVGVAVSLDQSQLVIPTPCTH